MSHSSVIYNLKKDFLKDLKKGKVLEWSYIKSQLTTDDKLEFNLLNNWYKNITELLFLNLDYPGLEEVFIHNSQKVIYKFSHARTEEETDIMTEDLQACFEFLTLKLGIHWNLNTPFASFDTTLQNKNVRISLIHHSTNPKKQSKCFIRILNKKPYPMTSFLRNSKVDFQEIVHKKKNIIIAGATGSGKTSFANTLLQETNKEEHLLILEDVSELNQPHENTTKLLADNLVPEKSLNQYMNYALRMSPDRIVLGEIRSKEVESFLLAMNTGHNGLISTIHSNNAKEAIDRFALLFKIYSAKELSYELILKLICNNIDYIVFLEDKKVSEVIQVLGSENDQVFYNECY